jgi:formylmethanofuran dehydrogenase subunit E
LGRIRNFVLRLLFDYIFMLSITFFRKKNSSMDHNTYPDLRNFLQQLEVLHDHLCPRQILGVQMGRYAAHLLDLELPQTDKRLFTFVETDGCFVDGILVSTGCTLGHRTLRLMDFGKVAATFVDTKTEHAVRIWPSPLSRQRAADYVLTASSSWHAQLEAYQFMPFLELFDIQEVHLTISLSEIISRPGLRVTCVRCGEEIMNEREVMIGEELLCRSCAQGTYYTKADST